MFYFHLFLSVFRKAYFRFFVSLNPLIKIFLLPSPSLPPSSLPPFLPLSLPSCLFFFFLFKPPVFPFFKKAAAHNASEATFVCFLLPPGRQTPGPQRRRPELESAQLQLHSAPPTFSPNCGTTCTSFWRSPSGLRRERWFSSALPSLAQVTHSLARPGLAYQSPWRAGPGPGRGGSAVAPF